MKSTIFDPMLLMERDLSSKVARVLRPTVHFVVVAQ